MDEFEVLMSPAELREMWEGYELWLDMVESSLPLPTPEEEEL